MLVKFQIFGKLFIVNLRIVLSEFAYVRIFLFFKDCFPVDSYGTLFRAPRISSKKKVNQTPCLNSS